ncbi:hypothetical protein I4J42_01695 [Corynebacterium belfantii]|uniref:hypothetical protein n=1 Tax=Corynebacterium belfantii TaxID=2014537 RepID=UPI0018D3254F|nr:hypothetical protein [Corynebacterium belfantii]MBG9332597.1 hypothetical protein [Corynebacterium belfantii]
MKIQSKRRIYISALCCALTSSAIAPVAFAQAEPAPVTVDQTIQSHETFQECANSPGNEVPEALPIGLEYGPGITESLTDELKVNLEANGKSVPSEASAIRHLDDGQSIYLNSDGKSAGELTPKNSTRAKRGLIPQKAKEIIGACLGFSWESGPLAEVIFREVTSVKTAVKFVIRRIGLGAAIGCVGGIIWHYI